jgi:hypothetical protein
VACDRERLPAAGGRWQAKRQASDPRMATHRICMSTRTGQIVFNQRPNQGSRVDLPITAGRERQRLRRLAGRHDPQPAEGSVRQRLGVGPRLGGYCDDLGNGRFAMLRPAPARIYWSGARR